MKFEDYIVEWKIHARLNVSDGWKMCQDQVLRDHILPYLGQQEVDSINPGHISEIINISKGKGHSKRMQRKVYNVLSKVFSDAVHFFEIIQRSPVKKRFHRPIVTPHEMACMTPVQVISFLKYTMSDPVYGLPTWIQCLSGLRISEIQALTPKDIDFKKKRIYVTKAYKRHTKKIETYPKGKDHYSVPITPMLERFLRLKIAIRCFACPNAHGEMLPFKSYDEYLKRVAKELGLDCKSSHTLRHACARLFAEHGASDEMLQILLGHKSLSSTKTYIHRSDEDLFEIANKIA